MPDPARPHLARRVDCVSPFLAMEIMERAKALEADGNEVIYLCLGEPDFPTPAPIVKAANDAMLAGETRYTHSLGRIELREALAAEGMEGIHYPPRGSMFEL